MSAEKSNQIKILHSFLRYPHEENPISHFPYNRTTKETRKRRKGNGVNRLYCYWKIWHQHLETMAYHLGEQKQDLQVREPKPSKSKSPSWWNIWASNKPELRSWRRSKLSFDPLSWHESSIQVMQKHRLEDENYHQIYFHSVVLSTCRKKTSIFRQKH